uniref:Flagellar basal body rod protein FlgB n=1 Tax=Pseudomonas syringae pv. actinidiae TaxID=103796 RepID=A0A286JZT9_PSESF|nr:Flagellar basal-body rod protein FlgB [Pseudomonas syringae pv. actinidiae]
MDFSAVLASQTKQGLGNPLSLRTTSQKHISTNTSTSESYGDDLLYSTPTQPSLDQNTVDQQIEIAKYTENQIHFDAAFTRLNGAFKGLLKVLRGD